MTAQAGPNLDLHKSPFTDAADDLPTIAAAFEQSLGFLGGCLRPRGLGGGGLEGLQRLFAVSLIWRRTRPARLRAGLFFSWRYAAAPCARVLKN